MARKDDGKGWKLPGADAVHARLSPNGRVGVSEPESTPRDRG